MSQNALGYLIPQGNPNIVGNDLFDEHFTGTQDVKDIQVMIVTDSRRETRGVQATYYPKALEEQTTTMTSFGRAERS